MNITPKNSHQELRRSVFCIFLRGGEKRVTEGGSGLGEGLWEGLGDGGDCRSRAV